MLIFVKNAFMKTLKIIYADPGALQPSPFNSRLHSQNQVEQIAKSIKDFGFNKAIAVDENNVIIYGHGAREAAMFLQYTEVPVVVLSHLSEREKRAYIIADNKLAENSTWDMDKLSQEFDALIAQDFDVSGIGFNEQEIDAILKNDPSIMPGADKEKTIVAEHERTKREKGNDQETEKSFTVIITCETAGEMNKVFNRLKSEGYQSKKVTT